MKPINNKSLLHFIFDQMEKLDTGTINVDEAKAQALLAKQANNSMKYELDRAKTLMELDQYKRTTGAKIDMRNVEGKNFD
jgi:hypothetical protein